MSFSLQPPHQISRRFRVSRQLDLQQQQQRLYLTKPKGQLLPCPGPERLAGDHSRWLALAAAPRAPCPPWCSLRWVMTLELWLKRFPQSGQT